MRKERILLLGGNYYPEPTGIGKYNGEMMDWLSVNGYECGVVTTFPYYPFWKIQEPYTKKSSWYKKEQRTVNNGEPIKIYRCFHYVPAIPIGSKRVLSDLSFFLSAFFQVLSLLFKKKYDYIITVAPPFQLGLLGILYKNIKSAKFIYHNQDLQIDAANELGMIKSKLLTRMMFRCERYIIRKADIVSSISEGMIKKIKAKYDREVILFPNWADTCTFCPILDKVDLKMQFDFSACDKIVLYSGAIGEKQGLHILLGSAKDLSFRKEVKFIICGSGPYLQNLVKLVEEMNLSNVIFMPLQPKEKFNQFLNMADIHLVLQKAKMNDIVMPSKLTTILSVGGLALITAEPETSIHTLIDTHKIGLMTVPENQDELTAAIINGIDHPHTELKKNARLYAKEYLEIGNIISHFFSLIMNADHKEYNKKKRLTQQLKVGKSFGIK